jgi:hypothetical protein
VQKVGGFRRFGKIGTAHIALLASGSIGFCAAPGNNLPAWACLSHKSPSYADSIQTLGDLPALEFHLTPDLRAAAFAPISMTSTTRVLPAQDGLTSMETTEPVVRPGADLDFTNALPARIAFQLRPGASVLALEPHGGQDILTAIAGGAQSVTAVDANPLIFEAAAPIYNLPQVRKDSSSGRSFSKDSAQKFDVLILSLISSFHPVRSGAYSLSEDYR